MRTVNNAADASITGSALRRYGSAMTDRTAVFIHGNPETAAIWTPLVETLRHLGADDIVTLSPPGFGADVPDGFDPTMTAYTTWLVGRLEELRAAGNDLDLVAHDWGAGHLYGALDQRPDLIRTWAADIAGVLHRDYVWHDMAQAWQTPDVGEQVVAGMVEASPHDKAALFDGLGLPAAMAAEVAAGLTPEMGRCILRLYRTAAQPAVGDLGARLGARLAGAELPPGLVIDAELDAYVPSAQSNDVAGMLGAEVLRLADRGHWWMAHDVDTIADSLLDFWMRH